MKPTVLAWWIWATIIAAIVLWAWGQRAHADGTWIVASVASHHFDGDRPRDYEQRNWGLGIEQDLARHWRATAGFYRNSLRNDSVYFGALWTPLSWGAARAGLALELVSGYERNGKRGEPVLAPLPVLAFEGRTFGVNMPFVPKTKDNVGAVGLQVKVRW